MEPSSGLPYGLQAFVDKVPVVWTRSPSSARFTNDSSTSSGAAESGDARGNRWTVGCRLDGTRAMVGRVDELAIWYWRLRDAAVRVKNIPATPSEYGELELFDGDLKFSQLSAPCPDTTCLSGAPADPPLLFVLRNSKSNSDLDGPADRDTAPAIEGGKWESRYPSNEQSPALVLL